ncbi:MAG TPA: glycosyltransferase [Salinimicrobium sp.]|nr:glycosyltransferase [Salinimicrobium sp.]
MEINYSFIIPVYNRPQEIRELLESMLRLNGKIAFEVVIVEDGSSLNSEDVVAQFKEHLHISYFQKKNTGPGDSRNFGMERAEGNYFLILDSDVVLPLDYLLEVDKALKADYVECFGGRDTAGKDFSAIQKAINYAMTSFYTTGGIRGHKNQGDNFQPRSFNMGLSRNAFESSGGFGRIHPGEDPDLSLRLKKMGMRTPFFSEVSVNHKRRVGWGKFYDQVYKFGLVRPILNLWHPESVKVTYWFPALFSFGFTLSFIFLFLEIKVFLAIYAAYFLTLIIDSSLSNRSIVTGILSVWAAMIQLFGYGFGFCHSFFYIRILKEDPEKCFPQLFFKHDK